MISRGLSQPSFGLVNGRPVFLDLVADSYFMLAPAEEQSFLAALRSCASDTPRPAASARPTRSALDDATVRPLYFRDLLGCWRFLTSARRGLAKRGLGDLVASLAQHDRTSRTGQVAAEALSRRFCTARRWVPREPHCLTDSLALLAFLRSNGAGADLVFGAKLDPFGAHCWLQSGTVLLNDRLDRIESFTPVCVVHS